MLRLLAAHLLEPFAPIPMALLALLDVALIEVHRPPLHAHEHAPLARRVDAVTKSSRGVQSVVDAVGVHLPMPNDATREVSEEEEEEEEDDDDGAHAHSSRWVRVVDTVTVRRAAGERTSATITSAVHSGREKRATSFASTAAFASVCF